MRKYFYYACSYPLGEGSMIMPGNWGRILEIHRPFREQDRQLNMRILREDILEKQRVRYYPQKPSRMKCTFLCEKEDQIIEFCKITGRILDIIYKVKIIQPEPVLFRADYQLMDQFLEKDTLDIWHDVALKYWKGREISKPEVLTLSPIQIVECIT